MILKNSLNNNIQIKYMQQAYRQALKAYEKNEVPVGAVILRNNKIIARAYNLKEKNQCALEHAEIRAIQKASQRLQQWRLHECEMYVTLEPCTMCASALVQARIKKVYFGAYDLKGGALSLNMNIHADLRLNHQFKMEYLTCLESEMLLKKFFKNLRKSKIK